MAERTLHTLLDKAWELLHQGDDDGAKKTAEEALAIIPEHPEALHVLAEMSLNKDEIEAATGYVERALKADPEYFPSHLMRVHLALAQDDFELARTLCEAAIAHAHSNDDAFEARLLFADVLVEDNEERAAQKQIIEAAKKPPTEPELLAQLCEALLDFCGDPKRAKALLEPAVKEHKNDADLHYALGRAYQELGEARYIEEFLLVHSLEDHLPTPPFGLTRGDFFHEAELAFAALPKELKDQLAEVAIFVEDRPSRASVEGGTDPRLMGLFEGATRHEGKNGHPSVTRVLLFQRNIEHVCQSREQIIEEIQTTLLHEIGHYLGLDEDDLHERGLD